MNRVLLIDNFQDVLASFEDINQVSCLEPALVSSITSRITVEKDTFKYFYYPVVYENDVNTVKIALNDIIGDVSLFTSFENQNPNDLEVIDNDSGKTVRMMKDNEHFQTLSLPNREDKNETNVYIGVKGKMEINSFKIEIKAFNSANVLKGLNLIYFILMSLIANIFMK